MRNLLLLSAVALLALGGTAFAAGENVSNYSVQGGADWEVGGALNVKSGGTLTVKSGGALAVASGGTLTNTGTVAVPSGGAVTVASGGSVALASGSTFTDDACLLTENMRLGVGAQQTVFLTVANRALKVKSVRARINTAAGGALTGKVQIVPEGVATTSAVDVTTAAFDLNAASTTSVAGTLSANVNLVAGDTLYWAASGAIASTVGVVTVCLGPQ